MENPESVNAMPVYNTLETITYIEKLHKVLYYLAIFSVFIVFFFFSCNSEIKKEKVNPCETAHKHVSYCFLDDLEQSVFIGNWSKLCKNEDDADRFLSYSCSEIISGRR